LLITDKNVRQYKNINILQELADYEKMPDGPQIDYKSEIYVYILCYEVSLK